jgi:ribosome biogenesis protein UTP30
MEKIDEGKIQEAVDALLKWSNSQKAQEKAQLLEDEQLLYVVISLKKIPERARTNPYRIPLPHPLFPIDGDQEVCLFVNDLDRGIKAKDAKAKVIEEGILIAKVIGVSKLKTDYYPHEAKRKLCGSYDLFLADDRILPMLPKLLGKSFFKKKKHPIPVTLTRQQWKGQITQACSSTYLYVGGGSCSVIKVARMSQSKEEIRENILAVINGAVEQVPKKWKGVQSIYLKTLESVALPLYRTVPGMPLRIDQA